MAAQEEPPLNSVGRGGIEPPSFVGLPLPYLPICWNDCHSLFIHSMCPWNHCSRDSSPSLYLRYSFEIFSVNSDSSRESNCSKVSSFFMLAVSVAVSPPFTVLIPHFTLEFVSSFPFHVPSELHRFQSGLFGPEGLLSEETFPTEGVFGLFRPSAFAAFHVVQYRKMVILARSFLKSMVKFLNSLLRESIISTSCLRVTVDSTERGFFFSPLMKDLMEGTISKVSMSVGFD